MIHSKYLPVIALSGLVLLSLLSSPGYASTPSGEVHDSILYVKPGAGGNCASWAEACDLQIALISALAGDQIRVAEGTYTPGTTRSESFPLKSGVAVYGGFPTEGGGWDSRDWQTHATILSGEIGSSIDVLDNSFHVVNASGVDSSAVLDGFSITGGYASGSYPDNSGGGILNLAGSPLLQNLSITTNFALDCGGGMYSEGGNARLVNVDFSQNYAHLTGGGGMCNSDASATDLSFVTFSLNSTPRYGGGMYNYASSPVLSEVSFIQNSATDTGEAYGGAMHNYSGSDPILTRVQFLNNVSGYIAGGVYNEYSEPHFTDVLFKQNNAGYAGGGMVNYQSPAVLNGVTFQQNIAETYAGGMDNYTSNASLTNVTFSGNHSGYGGGLFNTNGSASKLLNVTFSGNSADLGGGIYNYLSNPMLENVILWNNSTYETYNDNSNPTVRFSDIKGCGGSGAWIVYCGTDGGGNIDSDPMLCSLMDNGGYTHTIALVTDSPAVDAGDSAGCPQFDQRGSLRPQDGDDDGLSVCDMGAYELGLTLRLYTPIVIR